MNTFKHVRSAEAGDEDGEALDIASFLRDRASAGEDMNDYAVLTRTNRLADAIREVLRATGIEVRARIELEEPLDWKLARAALNLIVNAESQSARARYMLQKDPEGAEKRIRQYESERKDIPLPKKISGDADMLIAELRMLGVGADSIERIFTAFTELPDSADLSDLSMSLALDPKEETEAGTGATVCTVHAAKGREWNTVLFAGFEEEIIPGQRKRVNVEEERRVAYVGFTRAKNELIVTRAMARREPWGRGRFYATTPSRFLAESRIVEMEHA